MSQDYNIKISYVIPAFNASGTIREAVESIFNGNVGSGDEVVIINDCSADDTEAVILELKKEHPQIRYITNRDNLGCPATRNIGIKAAANDYIFNLDADDILPPGSVGLLKQALIKNNADMALFGESRYFIDDISRLTHKRIYKPGFLSLADFLAGQLTPAGNCLYTKKSWERIGGYWEYGKGLHEYWGFFLKQIANGSKLLVVKGTYYFHRHGGKSLFVREFKNEESSSLMATKMIEPFLHLLSDDDAAYIRSNKGSKDWFIKLNREPIRLKSGEVGQDGQEIILESVFDKILRVAKREIKQIFEK